MHIILPVTLVTAAAAALINFWLALRVGRIRMSEKVLVGDGGNLRLVARMRAHANLTEYAPFVLILMALIELAHGSSIWLWIAGAVFIAGRVLHMFGMDGWQPGRRVGIATTMVVMLGLAICAAILPFYHTTPAPITPAPIDLMPAV
jgi:uncharacterized membrane protein YecN with MAPEG domain